MRRCLFCGALYHISPQEKRAVRKSAARKCAEAPGGGGIYSFAAGFAALAAGARKRTSREAHTENAISAMGKTIIIKRAAVPGIAPGFSPDSKPNSVNSRRKTPLRVRLERRVIKLMPAKNVASRRTP